MFSVKTIGGRTGLLDSPVHLLELVDCVLLDVLLNDLDALVVVGEVRSVALQANHIKRFGRLQRAMQMEILSRVLGCIEVCGKPAIENGLSLEKIRI